MAGKLYLSRFRARNFRSFGEVDIALPAKPGLVLLEGPNGLGKTSWLEALEWVLSGRVQRWDQHDEQHGFNTDVHISRRGAGGGTCSVEVEFGEKKARWSEGQKPVPATWLCADPARWSLRADNLNGFLRGTHILPQSSSLRLLHLNAEERWNQVLRVVSGYSEIDDLSAALQGSKRPLTTMVTELAESVKQAQLTRDAWRARVDAVLDRRARAEASADLLAPSRAVLVLPAQDKPTSTPSDSEAGARDLIAQLNGLLVTRRSDRKQREMQLASLTQLVEIPTRWQAAQDALTVAEENLVSRVAEEQSLRDRLVQQQANEQAAVQRVVEAEALAGSERRRTDELIVLQETVAAIPKVSDALSIASRRVSELEAGLAEATARRDENRRQMDLRRAYENRLEAHERRFAAIETAAAAWGRVQELSDQHESLARSCESLKEISSNALMTLQAAQALLLECQNETAQAQKLAESVRAASGEVQGLVAALAGHVDEHSTVCPLCLAKYEEVGELGRLVAEAKERQGPAVARAEGALQEAVARETAASVRVEDAATAHAAAARLYETNQNELGALDREILNLRDQMIGIAVGREEDDLRAVRAALDHERGELANLPGGALESLLVLQVSLEKSEEEVRAVESSRTAAAAIADEAATTLAELRAREARIRDQFGIAENDDIEGSLSTARASQGRAEDALHVALEARAAIRTAREKAETALATSREHVFSALAARDQRNSETQEIARIWSTHGLGLQPSTKRLSEAEDTLAKQINDLEARIASIEAVVNGVGRWLEHAILDQEASELDVAASGTGPDAWHSETRRQQELVDMAERARQRAETVRDHVETMASNAEKRRASMRSELQARLSPVLAPMLRSLIVDKPIAQAVIELSEERKRTKVRATIGSDAIDLLALASEGQLSAVNLAVQLSMALSFRWCRWPAVLLDDPAQYSDVVHSTNLVETLRVLALHHGFQVVLATHERDFALYVERKFRNDGLSTTRVMFRQPSDPARGVVPRIARSAGDGG